MTGGKKRPNETIDENGPLPRFAPGTYVDRPDDPLYGVRAAQIADGAQAFYERLGASHRLQLPEEKIGKDALVRKTTERFAREFREQLRGVVGVLNGIVWPPNTPLAIADDLADETNSAPSTPERRAAVLEFYDRVIQPLDTVPMSERHAKHARSIAESESRDHEWRFRVEADVSASQSRRISGSDAVTKLDWARDASPSRPIEVGFQV